METVVITTSPGSFSGLVDAMKTLPVALKVEELPLISFRTLSELAPLDLALARLSFYRAVALTSPRAAGILAGRLRKRQRPGDNNFPAVWAAGAATAAALEGTMGPVRMPAVEHSHHGAAEALATAMIEAGARGPVLFPCGNSRRDELTDRLRREGIEVDEVVCYESVLASESAAKAAATRATVVVVASPSVAELLTRACPGPRRPDLIAAGPTTAGTARASGWEPAAVAAQPTVEAVTAALRFVLAGRSCS